MVMLTAVKKFPPFINPAIIIIILRQSVDCVDRDVKMVLINRDWYVDEKVNVIYEWISG